MKLPSVTGSMEILISAEAMLANIHNPPDDPGMSDEHDFFRLRRAAKTYISRVFTYGAHTTERLRKVRMVMDGSDVLHLGELEGALCLRLSGEKRRTQVTAVVTQDDKAVRRNRWPRRCSTANAAKRPGSHGKTISHPDRA